MTFSFSAQKRGKEDVSALRAERKLPGVLYGPEIKPVSVMADHRIFEKLYNSAGEASLIDLTVEDGLSAGAHGKPIKVLIQDVQYDPVKRVMTHFDLRQINMSKEMEVTVELNFVGEAPAVKALGGTLVKPVEGLKVKCLPNDLVSEITVDLSVLKTFDNIIRLKDLAAPSGLKLMDNPEMAIAKVQAPLTEEQIKAMEEEGKKGVEVVEQVEKKVKEGEVEEAAAAAVEGAKTETKPEAKKEEKKKE